MENSVKNQDEEEKKEPENGADFDLDDFLSGDVEIQVKHKGRMTFHTFRDATTSEYLAYQRRLAGIGVTNGKKNEDFAFAWLYDKLCHKAEVELDDGTRMDIPDFKNKVPSPIKLHASIAFNAMTYGVANEQEKN